MTVWVDVVSPSTVPFFKSLVAHLHGYEFNVTAGKNAETAYLLNSTGLKGKVIWKHPEYSGAKKYIDVVSRVLLLSLEVPAFTVGLGFANFYVPLLAKSRMRPSVVFTDNDSAYAIHDRSVTFKLADYVICPSAISHERLLKLGLKNDKIIQFDGYKEDVYISDYVPEPKFEDKLPIKDYVLVRPEATFAVYVKEKTSIVPRLLEGLLREGLNVLYLPRSSNDVALAKGLDVYIPKEPLNGLDLCWHSLCVMTGSGTFAREAACLGVPAASFFPGELLSVDDTMVRNGQIFYSRDASELVSFACSCRGQKRNPKLSHSIAVRDNLVKVTNSILSEYTGTNYA